MKGLMDKLQFLQSEIKKIAVDKQNQFQTQFLKEIEKTEVEKQSLLKLLKEDKLIENIKLNKKEKESISSIISQLEKEIEYATDDDKNILYYRTVYKDNKIDILLKKPKGYKVPPEIYEFISEVEDVQTFIKEVCTTEAEEDKYLSSLFGIVQVGGTSTYNVFAKKQLDNFKDNFVASKWWSLKLPFIKELGAHMIICVLVFFTIIIALRMGLVSENFFKIQNIDPSHFTNWFFILIGSSVGTWISFSLFTQKKTLDQLKSLRDNIPHPFYRLAIVGVIASIFYLFFITGLFNIEIGSGDTLSTKNIGEINYENMALIVGIIIGFSENTIGQKLKSRMESFTSKF